MSNLSLRMMFGGGILGFLSFVLYLESPMMSNIIVRNGEFAPSNIIHYMWNPFIESYLWCFPLWCANWLITTSVGLSVGALLSYIISRINT